MRRPIRRRSRTSGGDVHHVQARPHQAHGDLGIELHAIAQRRAGEQRHGSREQQTAKAAERVVDRERERLHVDPPAREPAAEQTAARRGSMETPASRARVRRGGRAPRRGASARRPPRAGRRQVQLRGDGVPATVGGLVAVEQRRARATSSVQAVQRDPGQLQAGPLQGGARAGVAARGPQQAGQIEGRQRARSAGPMRSPRGCRCGWGGTGSRAARGLGGQDTAPGREHGRCVVDAEVQPAARRQLGRSLDHLTATKKLCELQRLDALERRPRSRPAHGPPP